MANASTDPTARYDLAAPKWGDKMRTLGYYDGYLGFLSDPDTKGGLADCVIVVWLGECGSKARLIFCFLLDIRA